MSGGGDFHSHGAGDLTRALWFCDWSKSEDGEDGELGRGRSLVVGVVDDTDPNGDIVAAREAVLQPRNWHLSEGKPIHPQFPDVLDRRLSVSLIADSEHDYGGFQILDDDDPSPFYNDWDFAQKSTRIVDYHDPGKTALLSQLVKVIDDAEQQYTAAIKLNRVTGEHEQAASGYVWDENLNQNGLLDTAFLLNPADQYGTGRDGTPYGILGIRTDAHFEWTTEAPDNAGGDFHGAIMFDTKDVSTYQEATSGTPLKFSMYWDPTQKDKNSGILKEAGKWRPALRFPYIVPENPITDGPVSPPSATPPTGGGQIVLPPCTTPAATFPANYASICVIGTGGKNVPQVSQPDGSYTTIGGLTTGTLAGQPATPSAVGDSYIVTDKVGGTGNPDPSGAISIAVNDALMWAKIAALNLDQTVSALWTFDRGAGLPPFGVGQTPSVSTNVANLSAGAIGGRKVDETVTPTAGQALVWNNSTSKWVPGAVGVAGGGTGSSSFSDRGVIYYDGTGGTLVSTPSCAKDKILQGSSAGVPVWATPLSLAAASGSNVAGTALTISAGQSTGNAAGGSLVFKVSPAGTAGGSVNALATALTIDSTKLATFAGNVSLVTVTGGTWNGSVIDAAYGGTGQSTYTIGDLLYADSTSTLSTITIGTAGNVLMSNGAGFGPDWTAIATVLDYVGSTRGSILYRGLGGWAILAPGTSGYVLTSNGPGADPSYQAGGGGGSHALLDGSVDSDTAAGTVARGDLITGQTASPKWTRLALGASGKYLRSDGTDASWGTLDMGDAGAGTLAVGRGGTGLASYTLGDTLYASGATAISILAGNTTATKKFLRQTGTGSVSAAPAWDTLVAGDIPSLDASKITTGTLAVAQGGTNIASYTVGDLLYASASTTLSKLAAVATGSVLASAGTSTAPAWSTISSVLDGIGSTRGSILYRGASGWAILAPGTSGNVLTSNGAGADPTYQAGTGGTNFDDSVFYVYNHADNTRHIAFDASTVPTGSTNTFATGGYSGTLVVSPNASSGLNSAGTSSLLWGGQSTGNATGGFVVFKVSPSGSSGSSVNGLVSTWAVSPAKALIATSDSVLAWVSQSSSFLLGSASTIDTGLSRISTLIIGLGNGTQGDASGTLRVTKVQAPASTTLELGGGAATSVKIDSNGNVILNATGSALATNATNGFTYLPSSAGNPTGTPASLPTGAIPLDYDSTNNKLFAYSNALWLDVGHAPKGFVSGLLPTWASSTTISVTAGVCRGSADKYDIAPAAATLDITSIAAANGLDQKTSSATISPTNASPNATTSVSIVADLGTRTPTFTSFSTSTTTMTGVGTKFFTEVAIGDLVGNSTKGYSRVTAITSDTSLTLVAALPGGDAGGGSVGLVVIENPTIRAETNGDNKRLNTLSSDGKTIVAQSNWTGGTAGQTLKVGVRTASTWLNAWAIFGSSGSALYASTQRTTLLNPPSGYTTAARCLFPINLDGSSNIYLFYCSSMGTAYFFTYDDALSGSNHRVLAAGTATSFTAVDCSAHIPPTASTIFANFFGSPAGVPVAAVFFRPHGSSATTGSVGAFGNSQDASIAQSFLPSVAQACDYTLSSAGSTTTAFIDILGFLVAP